MRPPVSTVETAQVLEIVDDDEIGAPARRDEASIHQAENARRRNARRAIGGERRSAERDRRADDEIEMAFLGDVERIAVVGAERKEGRMPLGDDRGKRMQILRHRPFADENLHALGELLQRLRHVGDFVIGAYARAEIAVEVEAAQQGAVPVDAPSLERRELGEARGIARRARRGNS